MIIDIETGIRAVLEPQKRLSPCHVNRISQLDDPCLRRLYYMRHDWDKATEASDGLQGVFETGHLLEPVIGRVVAEVGLANDPPWRIIGSQTPTDDKLLNDHQISGRIDGFLQVKENEHWQTIGVIDIKTASPTIYPSLKDYNSLGKYSWTRKYRGQLMLYALAHNHTWAHILFVNKANLYQMRIISFAVDMDYCESLLQKAKLVNQAIQNDEPPAAINDPDECPKCSWYSWCCPSFSTGNLKIADDDELETTLDRLEELQPAKEEINELEKARDVLLTKGQDIAAGKWLITWKQITKQLQAQQARTRTEWRKKIVRSPRPDRGELVGAETDAVRNAAEGAAG